MDGHRGTATLWEILTALPDLRGLANAAGRREGYTTGSGAGVAYQYEMERLAEYDDMAEGDGLPVGHVQVFNGWGPPDGSEVIVPEGEYLTTLASVLAWAGFAAEASRVQALVVQRHAEPGAAADGGAR